MRELNELQRQILNDLKADIKQGCDMSIKEFAKRHYISPAFLVNLSKKLGYSGYKELIFAFKYNSRIPEEVSDRDFSNVHNRYIANYSEEMSDVFSRHMRKAKDNYVYAIGVGYSMIAVDFIGRKCIRAGYRFIYTENLGELSGYENSVGIMVSESGETQVVIDVAEKCRQKGSFTIAFLYNQNSRLGRIVDLPIVIPRESWEDELKINSFISNTIIAFQLLFSGL